jgi:hypothetical protein
MNGDEVRVTQVISFITPITPGATTIDSILSQRGYNDERPPTKVKMNGRLVDPKDYHTTLVTRDLFIYRDDYDDSTTDSLSCEGFQGSCGGRISVYLEIADHQDKSYDFPEKGKKPTVRDIVEKYLQDVKAAPLSEKDLVYFFDTSDFPRTHDRQLLKPEELNEPIFHNMGIRIQRNGDNKS